jgi:hypothetical protein
VVVLIPSLTVCRWSVGLVQMLDRSGRNQFLRRQSHTARHRCHDRVAASARQSNVLLSLFAGTIL